ncbi:hypothetical protein BDR05DRAFT_1015075 [Suillus weaverae]|nr:hypothetical protein BDR05DRAFT_1015075 [Suillus weaverae]
MVTLAVRSGAYQSFALVNDWRNSCLIPIQIAATKENCFIPLKDGVYSTELEESLLGADVNRIVDYVSFGCQKCMDRLNAQPFFKATDFTCGESFSLNHRVDTSFAGSAMRTTERVWMSVTLTRDALVVALDFEGMLNQSSLQHCALISESSPNKGVHSIERSTKEDTLLVPFNTAIFNLVLFRNNFTLSRDIIGLFQSFQLSATVLDPVASPSLFQSTLAIIIKSLFIFLTLATFQDVVDPDKADITKEHRIVQDEQEANFISRLHAGQLNIIPWPVIESQEFCSLFLALKLKTPMAKLKNLDDHVPIDMPDTSSEFSLAGGLVSLSPREAALQVLSRAWGDYDSCHHMPEDLWIKNLLTHINSLFDLRIAHVHEWISSNVARFQSGGRQGYLEECMKVTGHVEDDHLCAATAHPCGQVPVAFQVT